MQSSTVHTRLFMDAKLQNLTISACMTGHLGSSFRDLERDQGSTLRTAAPFRCSCLICQSIAFLMRTRKKRMR